MAVVRLTKTFIDDAKPSEDGKRLFYHDASLTGFMLIVGMTRKSQGLKNKTRP